MSKINKLLQRDFTAVVQIPDDLHSQLMKKSMEDFEEFGTISVQPNNEVPAIFDELDRDENYRQEASIQVAL